MKIFSGEGQADGRYTQITNELWKIFKIEEFEYQAVRDKRF